MTNDSEVLDSSNLQFVRLKNKKFTSTNDVGIKFPSNLPLTQLK